MEVNGIFGFKKGGGDSIMGDEVTMFIKRRRSYGHKNE